MKNQYIGDVGDYGKYGLLRFLQSRGIRLGVNWYLTPDDDRRDGRFTEYLFDDEMKVYDEALFMELQKLAFAPAKNVEMVEKSGILKDACFYSALLDLNSIDWTLRVEKRSAWHTAGVEKLSGEELVFADPDNSLSVKKRASRKDSEKYIFPNEVADYFHAGQNVVYYHHRSRKNAEGWMLEKMQMREYLPDAKLLAVSSHKWSNRAYIFVVHHADFGFYRDIVDDFISSAWGTVVKNGKPFFTHEEMVM